MRAVLVYVKKLAERKRLVCSHHEWGKGENAACLNTAG